MGIECPKINIGLSDGFPLPNIHLIVTRPNKYFLCRALCELVHVCSTVNSLCYERSCMLHNQFTKLLFAHSSISQWHYFLVLRAYFDTDWAKNLTNLRPTNI